MAQDRIDSIIDIEAIQQEINKVKALTDELATSLRKLPQIGAQIRDANSEKEVSMAHQKLIQEAKTLANLQNQRYAADAKVVALQTDYAKATAASRVEIQKQNQELKTQAELQAANTGSIERARAAVKALTTERNKLNLYTEEGRKKQEQLNSQIDKYNSFIRKNVDTLAQQKINIGNYPNGAFAASFKTLNTELDSVQKKLNSGNFKGEEFQELAGKQTVLQNALSLTDKTFKSSAAEAAAYKEAAIQIGQVYGKDSTVFKEYAEGVKKGAVNTKALANELSGASSKGKGFSSFLSTAYGGLRRLANILPNFGISTAILLLATAFGNAVQAAVKFFNTINSGKIAVQTLNDVNQKAVEIYSKQKSEVSALAEVVKDSSISLNDRKSALEKLIALNPDYLRGLTLENINTDEGRKILDAYNNSLQRKAELEAAGVVNANANQAVANLKAEREALVELSKAGEVNFNDLSETQQKFLGNFNTFTANFKFTASLLNTAISKKDIKTILEGIDKEIKTEGSKVDASLKIYKQKFAENLTADNGGVKGIIEKLQEKIAALQKIQPTLLTPEAITKNVAEIKKLQDQIDALLGKSKQNSREHLQSLEKDINTEFEIYKIHQQRKISQYNDAVNSDETYYTEKLSNLEKYVQASQELIERDEQNQIAAAKADAALKIKNLNDQKSGASADQIRRINENIKTEEANLQQAINLIQAKGNDQSISLIEDTAKKRKAIIDNQLKSEQDAYEDYYKILADQAAKDDKRIQEGFKKREQEEKDALEKAKDLAKQLKDVKINFALETEDALFGIGMGALERKRDQYNEEIQMIDDKSQHEIDAINASGLAQQEKDKKILAIQKQAEFQKQQIQNKQRANDLKLAKFERAQEAFQIAITTLRAVGEIKAQIAILLSNPITAWYAPIAAAQIPWVIGSGLAQEAAVLATPLPKYRTGTKNAKRGLALVSEEGPELLISKAGEAFLTPRAPSLIDLMGGEEIISHPKTEQILSRYNLLNIIQQANNKSKPVKIEESFNRKAIDILNKIERKAPFIIQVQNGMETTDYYLNNIKR